ncbi:MAG: ATP-binding cassette domain-containing protein [Desulfohalobiaceae bacterium]|nr:ATP-binding cassette domain-containing protein [Desulfohalobiaceae bacterium]
MNCTIQELSVLYSAEEHQLLALDTVSLELIPGRITALVGESGSGKTTLGKAVMGLLPEDARVQGSIRLDQTELVGLPEPEYNALRWSRVAMLFQNGADNLNPVHRIVDQLAEPLIHKQGLAKTEARKQVEQALQDLDLNPVLGRRFPHELSGGELQRCLLAMAFILNPAMVILDEPTAALDAMSKGLMARIMSRARAQGKALLLITHDLDLAARVADDVLILYLGQVMEILPARDLFAQPDHPYTLALGRSYPGLDTRRELGGIRGDAFYRVLHRHREHNGGVRPHSHIVGQKAGHEDGHIPPSGCLFQERCTQAVAECAVQDVPLVQVGAHQVRCLREGIVTALELQQVAKQYGEIRALQGTDVLLRAGETFCLVGESGSGKSTLAMIAAGSLTPDQGGRFFEGRDMEPWIKADYRSLAQKIGVVHQDPSQAVSHRFSVQEILAEPLRIQKQVQGKEALNARVREALKDVHLSTEPGFLKRYPHELNMGALQRVCIARALVTGPSLLVADEPTSSLDPSVQAKVLKMMLDLQIEKGLTMLFVTHDLGVARKIGDRTGVMLAGHLVETGPAAQVLEQPGHPYTQSLLEGAGGLMALSPAKEAAGTDQGCPFVRRCSRARAVCRQAFPRPVQRSQGWVACHHPL